MEDWRDPLDALWKLLCRPNYARVLLVLLAGALCLAQIVPQMPASAHEEPSALARWMAELPAFYRGQASWLRAIGLFDIYGALWFRALLGLLALSILVALADQLARHWSFLRGVHSSIHENASATREWLIPGAQIADIVAHLRADLLTRRYWVTLHERENQLTLHAIRWPTTLFTHLGSLVVLAGLTLNVQFGWQVRDVVLSPGQAQSLGHGDYELSVEHAQVTTPAGRESAELLSLSRGGRAVAAGLLQQNRPFRHGAITITQRSLGPLVMVKGESSSGRPLRLETHPQRGETSEELTLAFAPDQNERYFRSLDSGQTYRVILAGERLRVEAYRKGEAVPALTRDMRGGESFDFAGERMRFSLGYYVVVDARHDPAWAMVMGGGLFILTGIGLSLICRPSELLWQLQAGRAGVRVLQAGEDPYQTQGWPALTRRLAG